MKFGFYLMLLVSLVFTSCGKDDDGGQDGLLTGKIRGVDFTYGSGRFVDFGDQTGEFSIRIDNAGPEVTDSCATNSDDVYIRLDVKKETGRKDLFWDFSTGDGITVVFHHPDFFQNLIIDDGGWYDIKSFDSDELEIEFDINSSSDNNLKGKCTVYKCN